MIINLRSHELCYVEFDIALMYLVINDSDFAGDLKEL